MVPIELRANIPWLEARTIYLTRHGYDCKHAMHLVRLLRMCRETLTEGVVRVRRPDAEELRAIRDGDATVGSPQPPGPDRAATPPDRGNWPGAGLAGIMPWLGPPAQGEPGGGSMVATAVARAGLTWRGSYRAGPVAPALGDHVIPPADR